LEASAWGKAAWAEDRRNSKHQKPRVVTDEFVKIQQDYSRQRHKSFLV
jgi:hypothetical protein